MHEKQIEIRWRDMDVYGHVNNAANPTYLETNAERASFECQRA